MTHKGWLLFPLPGWFVKLVVLTLHKCGRLKAVFAIGLALGQTTDQQRLRNCRIAVHPRQDGFFVASVECHGACH